VQDASDPGALWGEVVTVEPLGAETLVQVHLPEITAPVIVRAAGESEVAIGDRIGVRLDPSTVHVFHADGHSMTAAQHRAGRG
jgi:ABC-type sugar transport system ATPase subunit